MAVDPVTSDDAYRRRLWLSAIQQEQERRAMMLRERVLEHVDRAVVFDARLTRDDKSLLRSLRIRVEVE